MNTKLIKDPVYGYLRIEKDEAIALIDSAEFQRLRNVRQTSYASVYPASVHNRFMHSLGVHPWAI
jgi:HD superfamily phosphohydrolase